MRGYNINNRKIVQNLENRAWVDDILKKERCKV